MGIIGALLQLYSFVILARVLMSWIPNLDHSSPIVQFLYQVTEPVLAPIREILQQFLPPSMGMIDFSPIVVFFIIRIIGSAF